MIFFANGRCSVVILSRPIFALRIGLESLSSLSFAQARLRTCTARGGGGGGTRHMKGVGMLVFSLRAVNFGFWSHLGCSGQNAIIFCREGLV